MSGIAKAGHHFQHNSSSPRIHEDFDAVEWKLRSESRRKKNFSDISPPTFDLGLSPTQKTPEAEMQKDNNMETPETWKTRTGASPPSKLQYS